MAFPLPVDHHESGVNLPQPELSPKTSEAGDHFRLPEVAIPETGDTIEANRRSPGATPKWVNFYSLTGAVRLENATRGKNW